MLHVSSVAVLSTHRGSHSTWSIGFGIAGILLQDTAAWRNKFQSKTQSKYFDATARGTN